MHEDAEQLEITGFPGGIDWWTFCTCGLAFGGRTSQAAYDRWAQHEAEEA